MKFSGQYLKSYVIGCVEAQGFMCVVVTVVQTISDSNSSICSDYITFSAVDVILEKDDHCV